MNTFVFQESEGEWTPFKVREVVPTEVIEEEQEGGEYGIDEITLTLAGFRDRGRVNKECPGDEVSLMFPELGMSDGCGVQEVGFSYYCGVRQFRKSFNSRVARTHLVGKVGHMFGYHESSRVDNDTMTALRALYQVMNNKYNEVFQSYEELMNLEKFSSALSRNFAVTSSMYSKYPVLVYRDTDVGLLVDGVAEIPSGYAGLVEEYETEVSKEVTIK